MNSFYNSEVFSNKKVLIIVPHMDDEINLAGSMIRNLAYMGCEIEVLYTTNGNYGGLGKIRQKEANEALTILANRKLQIYTIDCVDQPRNRQEHSVFSNPIETKETIMRILLESKPDIIFAVDMDVHPDHICASLLFEECVGNVLKKEKNYHPFIYKGFAYNTAYFSADDFEMNQFSREVLETKPGMFRNNSKKNGYRTSNPVYLWNDRVRFPIREECIFDKNNCIKDALQMHRSQNAEKHVGMIVNSDACFWERRTDNLLYQANITVSSGSKEYLNDFMLINSNDIMKRRIKYANYLWIPDKNDYEKRIRIDFSTSTECNKLVLYQNVKRYHRLNTVKLVFDDGDIIHWQLGGNIKQEYKFERRNINWLELVIVSQRGKKAGISELELFNESEEDSYLFIKIIKNNNFIYSTAKKQLEKYDVYGYSRIGSQLIDRQEINENIYNSDGKLFFRVSLKSNPSIYDEIELGSDVIIFGKLRRKLRNIGIIWRDLRNFILTEIKKARIFIRI